MIALGQKAHAFKWSYPYNLICILYQDVETTTEDEFISKYDLSRDRDSVIIEIDYVMTYLSELERSAVLLHFRDHLKVFDVYKALETYGASDMQQTLRIAYKKLRHLYLSKYKPLCTLDISSSCFVALCRNGISTFEDLLSSDFSTIKQLQRLGPTAIKDLVLKLVEIEFLIPGMTKEDCRWLKLSDTQMLKMKRRLE